jgi:beta-lactamase regulating signal transducer with metallopeptidase domain
LLVSLGSRVEIPAASHPLPAGAVEQISTYFSPVQAVPTTAVLPDAHVSPWPMVAAAVWFGGVVFLLFRWFRRWRMIHRASRAATVCSLDSAVPILSSPLLMEPGVFGVFRPVLLLPQGITRNLTREQLEAIVAHELCHVRRRDNLTAALHMCIETLFWFHPFVWWIGARLIAERERDCDESVLKQGARPSDYAHGILNVCRSYVESPLACASGVTGSELKQRIRGIMMQRRSAPMTSFERQPWPPRVLSR